YPIPRSQQALALPPLGVTAATQAASPAAIAGLPPRPAIAPLGMGAAPAPSFSAQRGDAAGEGMGAAAQAPAARLSDLADAGAVAAEAHLAFPQPLLRASMSSEYGAPVPPAADGAAGPHGPADMQRLFAPPVPTEQRTVTSKSLKRRIPLWVVAIASA